VLDASGNPVVSYYDVTRGNLKVLHCGNPSCTAGNTVTAADTADNVGQYTSLVLDASGNPVVSYYDVTHGNLKVLHCGNPRCTAGNTVSVPDQRPDVGRYTSLRLDGHGNPVVSYYDVTNGDLRLLRCGNSTCTAGNIITTPDTVGNVGLYTALRLDKQDNPVISYHDATDGNLKLLHCGDTTCSANNSLGVPDQVGIVGWYTSLMLDVNGNPVVSYYDATNNDLSNLKVLRCGNSTCTAGNSIVAPDTVGDVGLYTSLVLDSSGNPVVSYTDQSNGNLKLLHCGNTTCTAGNVIASPDTINNVGQYTSLTLDANGNPVVSYYDVTNGDVRVLHCGSATCLHIVAAPDTMNHVGQHTSLALDATGYPVVSYYDLTNTALKILHCGNPTCTVGNTIATADTGGGSTSLVLDAIGNPVVSYYAGGNLKVLHCGNATCTAGNSIVVADALGIAGCFHCGTSLVLDTSGNPVVSYVRDSDGALKVLHCGNPSCSAGNSIAVPGQGGLFSSLQLDTGGAPVITYDGSVPAAPSGPRVLHCGNANCTAGNTIATPNPGEGGTTSLRLDASGNPVFVYSPCGCGAGELKLVHCGNAPCTAGNTTTKPDSLAQWVSLRLDASGKPVVAYSVAPAGFRVLRCGNGTCSTGNTIATPDYGTVNYPSLALDATGNPVVSYNGGDDDLRVLHCGTPTCLP
jgi:hypothetical protein